MFGLNTHEYHFGFRRSFHMSKASSVLFLIFSFLASKSCLAGPIFRLFKLWRRRWEAQPVGCIDKKLLLKICELQNHRPVLCFFAMRAMMLIDYGELTDDDDDDDDDDDHDEDDDDDADDETLRRGCCVKRRTRHVTRVHLGGGMELDIQSRAEISGSEKRAPHDVHGCSSLSPFK